MTYGNATPANGDDDTRYVLTAGDMVIVAADEAQAALQATGVVAANLDVEVHQMTAATWERVREELAASNPNLTITDLTHR